MADFRPEAVGFSLNYLANVPEAVDLAKWVKTVLPAQPGLRRRAQRVVRGRQVLEHAEGAIDVVLQAARARSARPPCSRRAPDRALGRGAGRGHPGRPGAAARSWRTASTTTCPPGIWAGGGNKYFIGVLDPAASIEFTRGCPWDCSFCSAWTFYGRSYRQPVA